MSQKNIWKYFDDSALEGYTLIIPSVAVGNVGQLACDLLISSLNMEKYASIHTPALIPIVGYDPFNLKSDRLSGACEVYRCESKKIVAVQIRSPLIYKNARSFLEEVVEQFKMKQIRNIIILTSSFAHEKKHIMSSPFRFIAENGNVYENNIKAAEIMEHDAQDGDMKIYGGGFACLLYKICSEKSMPCLILYKYCSEGDNIPDAYEMVKCLNNLHLIFEEKKHLPAQLKEPMSWKLLFGGPPPLDIY